MTDSFANFAFDLLHKIAKDNEDSFFSPISVTMALAMAYAGSEGNTKTQMKKLCFGNADDKVIHDHLNKLLSILGETNEEIQCYAANRLYCKKDFAILQSYRDLLQKNYQSGIFSIDFNEITRKEINDWVSKTTHDKINDLLPSDSLDSLTRLILINALYFKGQWREEFSPSDTRKKPFYVTSNKTVDVDMMHLSERFQYFENDHCQVLSLPYKSYKANMVIVLPKDKFGFAKVQQELTGASFLHYIESMQSRQVNIQMPKMKFEQDFLLNDQLKAIGISDAFDSEKADFSRITGARNIYISDVYHKAFVDVNEHGTEAAAATAIKFVLESLIIDPRPPVQFVADHPFLFAITTNDNHILFLGCFCASAL